MRRAGGKSEMKYKMLLAIFLDMIIGMGMLLTPQPGLGQEGMSPYSIETDLVNLDLCTGESWEYWIWISNNVDREIEVNVSVAGKLMEFLDVENGRVAIPANSEKGARVVVSVPEKMKHGTYSGYVVIEGEGMAKSLPVSLKVGNGNVALLETNLELAETTIEPDAPLRFHVSLYNLGTMERMDVHLTYILKDADTGVEVGREEEDLLVETSHSFEKVIQLDEFGIESGNYIVEMVAEYDGGKTASSEGGFEAKGPFWSPVKSAGLVLLLLCVGTVSLKMYNRKRLDEDEGTE